MSRRRAAHTVKPMLHLARLSIRKPRAMLAASLAVAVALGAVGLGVSHSLSPSIVVVSGTESSRAQELANARFGPTQLVPILLQGPTRALNLQGPRLVRDLVRRPHTRALSAWDAGVASQGLRPSANAAMIVVSVDRPEKDVVNTDQPQIEALVARDVRGAVHASVTGQPSIDRALKNEALSTTRRSELIALAILFVLLLVGLRAPLAAATVTAVGAGVTLSTFGLMALLGRAIDTDPLAVALASMTGLALSVGYALLILDRFHQEEGKEGKAPPPEGAPQRVAQSGSNAAAESDSQPTAILQATKPSSAASGSRAARAATEAVAGTGRAILFAGTGLILALALASAIAPTKILTSLGIGVLLCSALAVGAAVVVVPAALVLFDKSIAMGWMAPRGLQRDWDRLVGAGAWVRRRAVLAGALATAVMVALAVPLFALNTGPPDVSQLPAGNAARVSFEEVARVMGPGWPTPYNMIVATPGGPITTAATLTKLDALQAQIARDPRVRLGGGAGRAERRNEGAGEAAEIVERIGQAAEGRQERPGKARERLGAGGQRRGAAAERVALGEQRREPAAQRLGRSAGGLGEAARWIGGGAQRLGKALGWIAPGAGGGERAEERREPGAGGLGGHRQWPGQRQRAGVGERRGDQAAGGPDGEHE